MTLKLLKNFRVARIKKIMNIIFGVLIFYQTTPPTIGKR